MVKKPTLNLGQLIVTIKQLENVTGHSADELLDAFIGGGSVSDNMKQLFFDTFDRIKDDPIDVAINAVIYQLIYKLLKKQFGSMAGRVDLGFFYLKPI